MESALRTRVFVDNDCNVVARGGLATGDIPSEGLYLVVTLGTGIGGTIVIDGELAYGAGHAGEFGHMTVEAGGKTCPCGSTGCWEVYAARDALMSYYAEAGGVTPCDPVSVAEMARNNHPSALAAFELFGRWAGIGFASLGMCFDPIRIYLAGGLSCTYPLFSGSAEAEFVRRCSHDYMVNAVDSPEEAGARGAAHMAAVLLA
jgi:glucokinase